MMRELPGVNSWMVPAVLVVAVVLIDLLLRHGLLPEDESVQLREALSGVEGAA